MSQLLLLILPGMILNLMLGNMLVTLVVYFLCVIFAYCPLKGSVSWWYLLISFVVVLFFQGMSDLVIQALYSPHKAGDIMTFIFVRDVLSPIIISVVVLGIVGLVTRKPND